MKKLTILMSFVISLGAQEATETVSSTLVTTPFSARDVPPPLEPLSPDRDVSNALLRKGCSEIYATNVDSILTQFSAIASPEERKEYKEFMLTLKIHSDLGFKLREFEKNIISDIRAVLRSPISKYSACRTRVESNLGYTMQTPGPPTQVLLPCEATYATNVQEVLNTFLGQVDEKTLKEYQDFMVALKYFEDLVFQIQEFEKKAKFISEGRNVVLNKLRLPLRDYETCRDALIRREMQQRYQRS